MAGGPADVFLFTRTRWDEPPRLRHQVARLLRAHGHRVVFFERAGTRPAAARTTPEGIELAGQGELVHHQLRVVHALSALNAAWVRRSLRGWPIGAGDLVVNFNYDAWYLRALAPAARVLTILNDDFVNRSRPWARREAESNYRRTLEVSDRVLTVSYPLLRQARAVFPRAELFLPWARFPYRAPAAGERPSVLYWGYINDRLDWPVIEGLLAAGTRIHFAGPIERTTRAAATFRHPSARYHGIRTLAELAPVIAECSCSILPYALDRGNREVTISNRAFDLLAAGLPLVYADYPELLAAPAGVFHRATTVEQYLAGIAECRRTFASVQPVIEGFLAAHSPEQRYIQLMGGAPGQ